MKIALIAIAVAVLSGLVFYFIGRPLAVYDYAVILCVSSIVVWTYEQYDEHHPQL